MDLIALTGLHTPDDITVAMRGLRRSERRGQAFIEGTTTMTQSKEHMFPISVFLVYLSDGAAIGGFVRHVAVATANDCFW